MSADIPTGSAPAAPTTADDVQTLLGFIREHSSGGCKVLSLGEACPCPLCATDRLRASLADARRQLDRDVLIVGADWMAGAICRLVDNHTLDARSEPADAMLDYASMRYGDNRPVQDVRDRYRDIQEQRRNPRFAAARAAKEPT